MDPFYDLYHNAGLIPIEIVTNGIIALIGVVGIGLNMSLVYVTAKTKTLHRPCNILIALSTLFLTFLQLGYTIKFFVFLFAINYIPLRTCYYIQFIPLIGSYLGITFQLCVGIDRLFGVSFPIWYKSHGKHILFKSLLMLGCVITIYGIYICYYGASQHWDKPVMCIMGEPAHQPENNRFVLYHIILIYCGEFVCYALIWIIFYGKKTQVSQKNKKLMISLSILMSIGLICFILNTIFFWMIMPIFNFSIFTIEYIILPTSTCIFLAAHGTTSPILFLCSTEYHNAFRKCFGNSPQQIQPMNVVFLTAATNQQNNLRR